MGASIEVETVDKKLAGLQIDLLQKYRNDKITLKQIDWWLNLSSKVRDKYMQPDFWSVIRELSQIVPIEHVIDCDAGPFVPTGWKVKSYKKGGAFKWSVSNVRLHLSENQQYGKHIKGNELRKELEKEPVLNVNVLDYLLEHEELIPEEWKGRTIFFWGTIYRDSYGLLSVRYLYWYGDHWDWYYAWLDNGFNCNNPAACSQVSN